MMTHFCCECMKMWCMRGSLTSAAGPHQAGQDLQPAGVRGIARGRHWHIKCSSAKAFEHKIEGRCRGDQQGQPLGTPSAVQQRQLSTGLRAVAKNRCGHDSTAEQQLVRRSTQQMMGVRTPGRKAPLTSFSSISCILPLSSFSLRESSASCTANTQKTRCEAGRHVSSLSLAVPASKTAAKSTHHELRL